MLSRVAGLVLLILVLVSVPVSFLGAVVVEPGEEKVFGPADYENSGYRDNVTIAIDKENGRIQFHGWAGFECAGEVGTTFTVGGEAGKTYQATVRMRGKWRGLVHNHSAARWYRLHMAIANQLIRTSNTTTVSQL
ncbi:MAG: hypothetical protein JRS35_23020, partial [Deltaproteobacteria bacterium]|nr:hypothetical protein [Deltaproteobacteria bacterium]